MNLRANAVLKVVLVIGGLLLLAQAYWFGLWTLLSLLNLKWMFPSPIWLAPLLVFVLYIAYRTSGIRPKTKKGNACYVCGGPVGFTGPFLGEKRFVCKAGCGKYDLDCTCAPMREV